MSDIFDLFAKISGSNTSPTPQKPVEWIIAGLGNPGREYIRTRHNAGFMCMDVLARKLGVTVDKARFRALYCRTEINGHGVILACPQTFMNSSGDAIREIADFYKIPPERVLVLVDDIYLDVGRLRLRRDGTDGGHNGLKSIIYQLNSDKFPRVRIGVGKKPAEYDMVNWVLGTLSEADLAIFEKALIQVSESVGTILDGKFDEAMQTCNGFRPQ